MKEHLFSDSKQNINNAVIIFLTTNNDQLVIGIGIIVPL